MTSRAAVRLALRHLWTLAADIGRPNRADGLDKVVAIQNLARVHARNIAVLTLRLNLGADPLSGVFRDGLGKAISLVEQNLNAQALTGIEWDTGRCDPARNENGVTPFAATGASDPEPRVNVCAPFFSGSDELRRDLITHEFFHLVRLADVKGPTTTFDLLRNANTMAQFVAFLNDRDRQANSDGHEPALPPLPMR